MIVGIGIDIIDNRRIQKLINKYSIKFKKKCFTKGEINRSGKINQKINFFSKRYAAKEACAKALGLGLSNGIIWKDIEIINDKYGKPLIKLHKKALLRLQNIADCKFKIEVSLSDEKNYSIANVIIIKDEK